MRFGSLSSFDSSSLLLMLALPGMVSSSTITGPFWVVLGGGEGKFTFALIILCLNLFLFFTGETFNGSLRGFGFDCLLVFNLCFLVTNVGSLRTSEVLSMV